MISDKYMQATIPALRMQSSAVPNDSNTGNHDQTHPAGAGQRRLSKVVGFAIPAPVKRQRPNTEITAQNVTLAIQHGVTEADRKEAMYNACAAFDHGVQAAHDDEIRVGADTAIFKHLTFLLLKRSMLEKEIEHNRRVKKDIDQDQDEPFETEHNKENDNDNAINKTEMDKSGSDSRLDSITEEIAYTLQGLEMVLRCSADCISVSFQRIGMEALPIILSLLQEQRVQKLQQLKNQNSNDSLNLNHAQFFQSSSTSSSSFSEIMIDGSSIVHSIERKTSDGILKTCTKLIAHFARVGSLTDTLASTKYLLATLRKIIAMPQESLVPIESRLNCLWIIANLACSAANMIKMASMPGIIDTLVKVASHPTAEEEEKCDNVLDYLKIIRSRSIAIRALLNLSWAHENKIPLSEHSDLVEILLNAVSHRESSWTGHGKGVSWILMQSRRHAAGALRNLAAAPRRYKRRLCRMRDGQFLESVAECATVDPDSDVRDKLFATLFNLVSADTAKLFVEKKIVLDAIVNASTSQNDHGRKDPDCASSRTMALQTLRALEKSIPEDEAGYDALRPALSRFDSQIAIKKSLSLGTGLSTAKTVPNILEGSSV